MTATKNDRLEELLVLRATQPLSPIEYAELEALRQSEYGPGAEVFDRAAAAIHVAAMGMGKRLSLPDALRARLERQALDHFSGCHPNTED